MKTWIRLGLLSLAVVMLACNPEVEDTTDEDEAAGQSSGTAGEIEVPTDTVWNHIVTIVYNGSSATVTVDADSVTYSVDGGDVTIKSQAKNIEYTASGSGSGSLKIYSDYRYKLTLDNLTLTSSGKPVINNQGKKSLFLTLVGTSTLSDSNGYATETSDKEDQKAAVFSEGQVFILGDGTLNLAGKNKHALASDDFVMMQSGTVNITAAATDGVHTNDAFQMDGGTLNISATDEGIAVDEGTVAINGGNIIIATTGTTAKGIKSYSDLAIAGGNIVISAPHGTKSGGSEGIESKAVVSITGGNIVVDSYDDGINAGGDLTVSGGYLYVHATNNDGIDANGNCYIKGGVIVAIGSGSPEVAIDANSEEQKKLYVSGGVLFTIGGLESGASLTQTCYSASSWTKSKWYSMTIGNDTYAFLTPSSGGNTLVVSGSSQPTVKSGVTVSDGTSILNGNAYLNATVSNGTNVTLSTYSAGQGGGGGGPGGGGGGGGWH